MHSTPYCFRAILLLVRVEWTDEFDRWLAVVEKQAAAKDARAVLVLDYIAAELQLLMELTEPPTPESETAQLKRVRQRRVYQVWRVSHPFDPDVAVRLICWFPPDSDTVVVAVFAGDKKVIGDVFYSGVGPRADDAIGRWVFGQRGQQQDEDSIYQEDEPDD